MYITYEIYSVNIPPCRQCATAFEHPHLTSFHYAAAVKKCALLIVALFRLSTTTTHRIQHHVKEFLENFVNLALKIVHFGLMVGAFGCLVCLLVPGAY